MVLIADFCLVAGMVVALIILFSLWRSEQRELPQQILLMVFVAILFTLTNSYCELHDIDWLYLVVFLFSEPIGYFVGPMLYIYIKSLYLPAEGLIKQHWLHFIPLFLIELFLFLPIWISFLMGKPLFQYLADLRERDAPLYEGVFHGIYFLVYCLLSLRLLNKYHQTSKLNFSNLLEKDLTWIKNLLIGLSITIGIDVAINIYEITIISYEWDTGIITAIFLVFVMLYLGYYGTSQSRILLPDFILVENHPKGHTNELKRTSGHHLINAEPREIEMLQSRLIEMLRKEKVFLDPDLTLGSLAKMIPTTDKKLSALLNHHLHISFYDLINQYRVEEVKLKLIDPDFANLTLLALAYESGFKSKTSFNRIFKKATGVSPSVYKKASF